MTAPAISRARAGSSVAALWLIELAAAFENAMIFSAVGKLIAVFHDPSVAGWLVTVFMLVGAGTAVIAGRLGDLYGRRRVLLILLAVATVGSVVSLLSDSLPLLVLGRALQGFGAAALPLSLGLVREMFPEKRRPAVIGIVLSGSSAGVAAGLVLGGMIVDHLDWKGIFVAGAGLSTLAFLATLAVLPKLPPQPRPSSVIPVDWIGGLLFLPGVGGLLLVISNGKAWGWASATSVLVALGAVVLLTLWVLKSLRSANPLIDVRLFKNPVIALTNAVTALASMSALQIMLVFSVLLQTPAWTGVGLGASATVAGLTMLPSKLVAFVGGPLSGWLTGRTSGRVTMLIGGGVATLGWGLTLIVPLSLVAVGFIMCLIALGAMMLFTAGPSLLIEATPDDRTSEAAGVMSVVRQTFIGVGSQLVGVLLAVRTIEAGAGGVHYPTTASFHLAIWVIIGLGLAGMVAAFMLPRRSVRT